MNHRWRWLLPWYLWTLPLVLFAAFLMPFYRPRSFRWNDGVLTCLSGTYVRSDGAIVPRIFGKPAGQTFGWIQFYAGESFREKSGLRIHETTHTFQSLIFGLCGFLVFPPLAVLVLGWSLTGGLLVGCGIGATLYGLLYLIFFLAEWVWERFGDWRVAYLANPFERQARAVAARGHGWGE